MCAGEGDDGPRGDEGGKGAGETAIQVEGKAETEGRTITGRFEGARCGANARGDFHGLDSAVGLTAARAALLVDGDHISPSWVGGVVEHLEWEYWVHPRLVVADWGKLQGNGWGLVLAEWALRGVHQPGYTSGKNATDVALVIAAMDLLHGGEVEAFAIVSGDSDFTPLAVRLREAGKRVVGYGPQATSRAFRAACDVFWELPLVMKREEGRDRGGEPEGGPAPGRGRGAMGGAGPERTALELGARLLEVYEGLKVDGREAVTLAALANVLYRDWRGFRPQQYGHGSFLKLVRGTGLFELEQRAERAGSAALGWVVRRREEGDRSGGGGGVAGETAADGV
jgi:uncharacterized LabA/DUF88 family protein